MIKIYTDGSCHGNPGPGGYALIIIKGDEVIDIRQGYSPVTTNNQMELQAIRDAIIYCIEENVSECRVYSDSQYSVFGINDWMRRWHKNKWRGSKGAIVANVALWQEVYFLWNQAKDKLHISIHYVKGHSTDKYNNLADQKASEIIKEHTAHENNQE